MKSKPAQSINKGECCRRFGWTRYEFDKNVAAGMPVLAAAGHKGAEWQVDLGAVARWVAKREAEEATRRRRVQVYLEERRREAERAAEAFRARERARREAERRREAAWEAFHQAERLHRDLERAYRACERLALADYREDCARRGVDAALAAGWRGRHPGFTADWPPERPEWWMPPPGMLEAVKATPWYRSFECTEAEARRWWPGHAPGRPWPWRDEAYRAPVRPVR